MLELDSLTFVQILGVVISILLLVVGSVLAYERLKEHVDSGSPGMEDYPIIVQAEKVLLPYIFRGIMSAYRLSEYAIDEVDERLDGADKKEIADRVYSLLPDEIGGYSIRYIKALIPRERFSEMVQDVFDEFDTFFENNRVAYAAAFSEWKRRQ